MTPLPPYSRLSTPITLPLNCTPNFYQEIIINWIIIFHIHSSRHWNKHQPILGGKQKFYIMNQKFCREQKKKVEMSARLIIYVNYKHCFPIASSYTHLYHFYIHYSDIFATASSQNIMHDRLTATMYSYIWVYQVVCLCQKVNKFIKNLWSFIL